MTFGGVAREAAGVLPPGPAAGGGEAGELWVAIPAEGSAPGGEVGAAVLGETDGVGAVKGSWPHWAGVR